jgi:hypothetical protein
MTSEGASGPAAPAGGLHLRPDDWWPGVKAAFSTKLRIIGNLMRLLAFNRCSAARFQRTDVETHRTDRRFKSDHLVLANAFRTKNL